MTTDSPAAEERVPCKPVNLALQGGGSHGAFGWGVLDRLLEDGRLSIEAISATSAGAMNAVVMAAGYSAGGASGARAFLHRFWHQISEQGAIWSPLRYTPWERFFDINHLRMGQSPMFTYFQALTQIFSPYELNPFDINPLRDVLTSVIDFAHLRQCPIAPRLFINTTNVRTGKIRIFENHEISPDVILASACLPFLFRAVEIAGEHYWDGGYMGNPAIFPLIYRGASRDVVIVHINPLVREKLPTTAAEILNRMNEISFNSSLMREMRAIAFVSRLIEDENLDDRRYKKMLIHAISNDAEMVHHGVSSKLDTDWQFLRHLFAAGRETADRWLAEHFEDIGRRTTVDLAGTYL